MSKLFDRDQKFSLAIGGRTLIGVDEVGRGCLAGPVVACAAVSPTSLPKSLAGIRDSKVLLPEKRLKLYRALRAEGIAFAIGWATPEEIDRINILQACFLAMRRAIADLTTTYDLPDNAVVVVDGNQRIPGISLQQKTVIKGDNASFAIAAASVAAKVVRDRWMSRADYRHPGYGLAGNKGYGAPDHLAALKKLGPTPIHRRSFAPVSALPVFA